jgi:spore germination protein YaaH
MLLATTPIALSNTVRSLLGVGYYVDFDPNSWTSVRTEAHRLNWVITTTFVLADATGRLAGSHDPRVVSLVRSRGSHAHFRVTTEVPPTSFAHIVLLSPAARLRAIASILQALRDYGYDGVVVDLQNLTLSDRQPLNEFVTDLATQLHNRGRPLSVVVPATAAQTPSAIGDPYDLVVLGRAADWIILNAYDDQRPAGPIGPLAPLPWVEALVTDAIARVPAAKVLLGIGLFGYDWPARGTGASISMREAVGRARRGGAPILWDDQAQTPYFTLFDRTVHFEDARSIDRKLSLATRHGLAGVAFCRLGCETPDLWATASAYLRPPHSAAVPTH